MTVAEAMACVEAGYFAPGSMLPKVLAAVDFVGATGKEAIITSPENVRAAVSCSMCAAGRNMRAREEEGAREETAQGLLREICDF